MRSITDLQREYAYRPWFILVHRRFSCVGHRFNTLEEAIAYANGQWRHEIEDHGTDVDYWVRFEYRFTAMGDLT